MEDWSPGTLVRTGFCCVDDYGNVVSIWNFGDLEDALRGVDSSERFGFGPVVAVSIEEGTVPEQSDSSTVSNVEVLDSNAESGYESGSIVYGNPTLVCSGVDMPLQPYIGCGCRACAWREQLYCAGEECAKDAADYYDDMPELENSLELPNHLYAGMPGCRRWRHYKENRRLGKRI
ncbi:hypothetical protein M758_UG051800 [Ceratodon purpureus]|nr:hypothetical protein M758_UG051800 [Ceratodon purpureus]